MFNSLKIFDSIGNIIKTNILPNANKITNKIFIGNILSAVDNYFLVKNNIQAILSLSTLNIEVHKRIINYKHIYINDDPYQDIMTCLDTCTNFIDSNVKSGYNILVHCEQGISRSPAIVIAYLIKFEGLKTIEAYDFVKSFREIISPNWGFMVQLKFYEFLGRNSILNDFYITFLRRNGNKIYFDTKKYYEFFFNKSIKE
jgi:protein-tyrosine phosphatase